MSDDRSKDDEKAAAPGGFSRRKLFYAAPAFLTRKMFYAQGTCQKAGSQTFECSQFGFAS